MRLELLREIAIELAAAKQRAQAGDELPKRGQHQTSR